MIQKVSKEWKTPASLRMLQAMAEALWREELPWGQSDSEHISAVMRAERRRPGKKRPKSLRRARTAVHGGKRSVSAESETVLRAALDSLKQQVKALEERLAYSETAPVVRLLEEGRLDEARELVDLLLLTSPSPKLEQWAKVLAPPVVRVSNRATSRAIPRNNAWLREHRHEYAGKWVALRDGVLLGADEDRVALHRRLEQRGELAGAAFACL